LRSRRAQRSSRRGTTASQPSVARIVAGPDRRDRLRPPPCAGRSVVEHRLQDRRRHQPPPPVERGLAGAGTRWLDASPLAEVHRYRLFTKRDAQSHTSVRCALLCPECSRLSPWSVAPPAERPGSTGWSGSRRPGRGIQDPVVATPWGFKSPFRIIGRAKSLRIFAGVPVSRCPRGQNRGCLAW